MRSEQYDLEVYEQESLNVALTLYTDDAATTLWNLTGYSASLRIMDSTNGDVLSTLTSGSGLTLGGTGGTAGTITISRTPAQVQALNLTSPGAYDLTVTSGGGTATLLMYGSFTVVRT